MFDVILAVFLGLSFAAFMLGTSYGMVLVMERFARYSFTYSVHGNTRIGFGDYLSKRRAIREGKRFAWSMGYDTETVSVVKRPHF